MKSTNKKSIAVIITTLVLCCIHGSVKGNIDHTTNPLLTSYSLSYKAGYVDANKHWVGGTETMNIVEHNGKLYAGVGYWMVTLPQSKGRRPLDRIANIGQGH